MVYSGCRRVAHVVELAGSRISTAGIRSTKEQEQRATSALLAVIAAEIRRARFHPPNRFIASSHGGPLRAQTAAYGDRNAPHCRRPVPSGSALPDLEKRHALAVTSPRSVRRSSATLAASGADSATAAGWPCDATRGARGGPPR